MTDPLIELAARCEAATGADRELDREILFVIFPKDRVAVFDGVKHISTMTGRDGEPWFNPLADRDDCPRYTGSLGDAMELLVPDRCLWKVDYIDSSDVGYITPENKPVTVYRARVGIVDFAGIEKSQWSTGRSFTSATLAFCAASLRARAHLQRHRE